MDSIQESRLLLRLPETLKSAATEAARINRRSLNSEILIALERHVAKPEPDPSR